MNNLSKNILSAISTTLSKGGAALHEPIFCGREKQYVLDCLESTFVSSVGEYVNRFEHKIAEYTGAKYAVAVVNGTAALQIALQVSGVRSGDEVIVPALTFVATANAVHYLGAVPHFVDSNKNNLGIDVRSLREWLNYIAEKTAFGFRNKITGRRISTLVPMHVFGHPCDIEGLNSVAYDFQLTLIEDAAESLGSTYNGKHTGTFGLLGAFSFNGNKIITTGGGGAIVTNDEGLAKRSRHLTTTAKIPHRWRYFHDEVGFNYRMPNINAALGCAQIEQIPMFLSSKRKLFERYKKQFELVKGVSLVSEPNGCVSNYWLQTLLLDEENISQREKILEDTNNAGYMTRPAWELLHRLPAFESAPRSPLIESEMLEKRIINIPSSANLI